MRNYYLVTYDITNNRRRCKVAKITHDFGDRLQYSVFGCALDERGLQTLKYKLRKVINKQEDQVLFTNLGTITNESPIPDIEYIGKCWIPEDDGQIV